LQHHDTMSAALPGAIVPILSSSPRIRRRSKWRCEWPRAA
jgi:hypothetical protein